jgi:CelD/BcsL family acetyltransferase involved in cellulose biosynthesis
MLTIEVVDTYDRFLKLVHIWNNLLSQTDVDFPFLTFEWVDCWLRSYGKNSTLLIILVKDNDEIIGVAPFMILKLKLRGITTKAITFLANYHTNRFGLILYKHKKDATERILKFIKHSAYKFDLLLLNFIANDSDTDMMLNQVLKENKYHFIKKTCQASPYIPINGEWESYLKTKSQNFRHKLNRTKNNFERLGTYEIVKYTNNNVTKALAELLVISRLTWKNKKNTAIVSNPENTDFYSALAHKAAHKGWLNIWILKHNQTPIAFAYNLEYKNKIFALKIGFDERLARLSPSEFLNTRAIKDCFESKKNEYDWLGESLPFKLKWTSFCREHSKYLIFNNTAYGRFLHFLESKMIPYIKHIYKKESTLSVQAHEAKLNIPID